MPWVYLSTLPDGDLHPCCVNDDFIFGNVKDNEIKDIWNTEKIKKLRKIFMYSNTLPKECERCKFSEKITENFELETNSTWNLKYYYNNYFKHTIKEIYDETLDDGSIPEEKIKFKGWNFRVSNKCNFKCRMCNPTYSSLISEEIDPKNKSIYKSSSYHQKFLEDNINDLELIEISGGECLLWEETYDMMDYILKLNKQNQIKLYFNTNMSVKGLGKKLILDYWRKWDPNKLEVVASIDEIDERSECIRKGTNWKTIEKNLKELGKEKFIINTNITVSVYNIFRLPEIIERLIEIEYINKKYDYKNFMISPVMGYQDISILSSEFKEKIIIKLVKFIKYCNEKYSTNLKYHFLAILKILKISINENDKKLRIYKFIQNEYKLNKIRNENIFEIIPELNDILNQAKNIDTLLI